MEMLTKDADSSVEVRELFLSKVGHVKSCSNIGDHL